MKQLRNHKMECTQRLECTQDLYSSQSERVNSEQVRRCLLLQFYLIIHVKQTYLWIAIKLRFDRRYRLLKCWHFCFVLLTVTFLSGKNILIIHTVNIWVFLLYTILSLKLYA